MKPEEPADLYVCDSTELRFARDMKEYETFRRGRIEIKTYILATILPKYHSRVIRVEHPWDILKKLELDVASTRQARINKITSNFERIKEGPVGQDPIAWAQEWNIVYLQSQKYSVPKYSDPTLLILDFLDAIHPLVPYYAEIKRMEMIDLMINPVEGKELPEMIAEINRFRHYVQNAPDVVNNNPLKTASNLKNSNSNSADPGMESLGVRGDAARASTSQDMGTALTSIPSTAHLAGYRIV